MQNFVSNFLSIFDMLMDQQQIIPTLNQLAPTKRMLLTKRNVKVGLVLKTVKELI